MLTLKVGDWVYVPRHQLPGYFRDSERNDLVRLQVFGVQADGAHVGVDTTALGGGWAQGVNAGVSNTLQTRRTGSWVPTPYVIAGVVDGRCLCQDV